MCKIRTQSRENRGSLYLVFRICTKNIIKRRSKTEHPLIRVFPLFYPAFQRFFVVPSRLSKLLSTVAHFPILCRIQHHYSWLIPYLITHKHQQIIYTAHLLSRSSLKPFSSFIMTIWLLQTLQSRSASPYTNVNRYFPQNGQWTNILLLRTMILLFSTITISSSIRYNQKVSFTKYFWFSE